MKQLIQGVLFIIAVTILLALFLAFLSADSFAASDPNSMVILKNFVHGWLSPGPCIGPMMSAESWVIPPSTSTSQAWTQKMDDGTWLIIRAESTSYLKFTVTKHRPVNYMDFANQIAKKWQGNPSFKPPVEPNKPADPCAPTLAGLLAGVNDPNLLPFIRSLMEKQ